MKNQKDSTLAGVLSFLIPGLGQIYVGKTLKGIMWFVIVVIGWTCLIIPGFILWIINIWDANNDAKEMNKQK